MTDDLARTIPQIGVGCTGLIVTIELICSDEYSAQIVFDDIRQRIQSPQGFSQMVKATDLKPAGATP